MTPEELEAIKQRVNAATPGPWEADYDPRTDGADQIVDPQGFTICFMSVPSVSVDFDGDTDFIAHARADVPALVAEVERLRAENTRLVEELSQVRAGFQNYVAMVDDYYDDSGR